MNRYVKHENLSFGKVLWKVMRIEEKELLPRVNLILWVTLKIAWKNLKEKEENLLKNCKKFSKETFR